MTQPQVAKAVLMIKPKAFGYNQETAANNYFQPRTLKENPNQIAALAAQEFDAMVATLRSHHIHVHVVTCPELSAKDALFPNNWVSFRASGQMVVYPMFAVSRRLEKTLKQELASHFSVKEIKDFSYFEAEQKYCEGTGSIVFDHTQSIAYGCISERTHKEAFVQICQELGYTPCLFTAFSDTACTLPIYHTNVVMSIGASFAVVCLAAIPNEAERKHVETTLKQHRQIVIDITLEQLHHFCGNILEVAATDQSHHIIMSKEAFAHFTQEQKAMLTSLAHVIVLPLTTIETYGGGSARCMLCEVF